ncbi:phospholipase D family protein [Bradyrhizobium sp. USDA 3315]
MNEVLTDRIWREVAKRARSAPTRKTAIAYVTTDDIGLRAGDVLVTDASPRAIRSGQTDAKLLLKLHGAGVVIYSREGLHSKVALFGKHAIVGSANMSGSNLIEASVITDNPVVVSGVAAFIKKLSTVRTKLSAQDIQKLCAIEVVRTGRFAGGRRASNPVRRLGKATWILGVREVKDPTEPQQKRIDRRTRELKKRLGTNDDDLGWIQWGKKSRFGRECRAGDTLIQIWNSRDRKRSVVTRRVRVLLKDEEPVFNRFYTQDPAGKSNEVNWRRFQRILKRVEFPRDVKRMSALKLDPAMAEIIDRKWTRVH